MSSSGTCGRGPCQISYDPLPHTCLAGSHSYIFQDGYLPSYLYRCPYTERLRVIIRSGKRLLCLSKLTCSCSGTLQVNCLLLKSTSIPSQLTDEYPMGAKRRTSNGTDLSTRLPSSSEGSCTLTGEVAVWQDRFLSASPRPRSVHRRRPPSCSASASACRVPCDRSQTIGEGTEGPLLRFLQPSVAG